MNEAAMIVGRIKQYSLVTLIILLSLIIFTAYGTWLYDWMHMRNK